MEGVILSPLPIISHSRELTPDVAKGTLGYSVVSNEIRAVAEEAKLDDLKHDVNITVTNIGLTGAERTVDRRQQLVGEELEGIRNKISGLSAEHAETFEKYCNTSVSGFIRVAKDGTDEKPKETREASWQEWLGGYADNAQLLNFLQWHTNAMERVSAHPRVSGEIGWQKYYYQKALLRGVSEDWLHLDALRAVKEVDGVKTYVGDLFDTTFRGMGGYHHTGTRETVIATASVIPSNGDYWRILYGVGRFSKHEFNHAVLGELGERLLNEAVTEHIAHTMEYGEVDIVDPHRRGTEPPVYRYESEVLTYLLEEGASPISIRLATRAYSERSESGEAHRAFITAFDEAWNHLTPDGRNAYNNFNAYTSQLEAMYKRMGMGLIEAGERAARDTLRDLEYQPEVVFAGTPEKRQPVLA